MKHEKKLAQHMLAHRAKGFSVLYVIRKSVWHYLLLVALTILLIALFVYTDDWSSRLFAMWGVGMFCGAVIRDFGWIRGIKKNWPFTLKVTDWKKVEDIAAAEESANN